MGSGDLVCSCGITLVAGDTYENPFIDVKSNQFYYDAVLWAVEKGITIGMTATTFEPNTTCTRGQIVTFLWRASGSPEPTTTQNPGHPFSKFKDCLWIFERSYCIMKKNFNGGNL